MASITQSFSGLEVGRTPALFRLRRKPERRNASAILAAGLSVFNTLLLNARLASPISLSLCLYILFIYSFTYVPNLHLSMCFRFVFLVSVFLWHACSFSNDVLSLFHYHSNVRNYFIDLLLSLSFTCFSSSSVPPLRRRNPRYFSSLPGRGIKQHHPGSQTEASLESDVS